MKAEEERARTAREELWEELAERATDLAGPSARRREQFLGIAEEFFNLLCGGAHLFVGGEVRRVQQATFQGEYGDLGLWTVYTQVDYE